MEQGIERQEVKVSSLGLKLGPHGTCRGCPGSSIPFRSPPAPPHLELDAEVPAHQASLSSAVAALQMLCVPALWWQDQEVCRHWSQNLSWVP